jgi:hypothetical protein
MATLHFSSAWAAPPHLGSPRWRRLSTSPKLLVIFSCSEFHSLGDGHGESERLGFGCFFIRVCDFSSACLSLIILGAVSMFLFCFE